MESSIVVNQLPEGEKKSVFGYTWELSPFVHLKVDFQGFLSEREEGWAGQISLATSDLGSGSQALAYIRINLAAGSNQRNCWAYPKNSD